MFSLVVAVGMIVAGVFFIPQAEASGMPVKSSLMIPAWTAIVLIGWLAYRFGVFSDKWDAFTTPQKIILKTDKTPFQVFMGSVNSCFSTLIGGSILTIIALTVTGHGDVAVQIVQMFEQKLIRLIEALLS